MSAHAMKLLPVGALLLLATQAFAEGERTPVFEIHALGVLGGEDDSNLSCYLLGRAGEPPRLMLDGGSIVAGIVRERERSGALAPQASASVRAGAVRDTLSTVDALLLTHSHLDHLAGFLLVSPMLMGSRSMELLALPQTLEAVTTNVFHSPLWLDLTSLPLGKPLLRPRQMVPGTAVAANGFNIEAVALDHTVPSAAWFVSSGADTYLHLGDTGPTNAVWDRARPLLQDGRLRAVAIEVSFPSGKEDTAIRTGHLTPRLLLAELSKLARPEKGAPAGVPGSRTEAIALARKLAPSFRHTPVLAIHIKASGYDDVRGELEEFRRAGLNLVIPEQGATYRF